MKLPDFLMALPSLDVPFPADVVESRAMRTEDALLVFFIFHKEFELPAHSHKAQWGTVLQGEIILTIGDETRHYGPGDSYDIPSGVEHSGQIHAGSIVIDVFEEPDRYSVIR
ncbi:cupin domain-containing protein [Aliiruegeria sabulilitoris]|uniref:cupin domain-containing protein n=1 Tax=Aliiruegeria sabulilitoris TaxID=1510458 RepID=UPI00082EB41A|nr:cupin domain-containing protein [Aliiruegeria sabulilitoris]NDR54881.1 cupin domain-containing protein [Pseudoruegeria sp. M32A2M]